LGKNTLLFDADGQPDTHLLRKLKTIAHEGGLNCGKCEGTVHGRKVSCSDAPVCKKWFYTASGRISPRSGRAKAHPLVVEQTKDARERGYYIHPELYGASKEQSVAWARHPGLRMKMQDLGAESMPSAQQQSPIIRAETQPLPVPPNLTGTQHLTALTPLVKPVPAQKQTAPRK
jgi:hypothetical protein